MNANGRLCIFSISKLYIGVFVNRRRIHLHMKQDLLNTHMQKSLSSQEISQAYRIETIWKNAYWPANEWCDTDLIVYIHRYNVSQYPSHFCSLLTAHRTIRFIYSHFVVMNGIVAFDFCCYYCVFFCFLRFEFVSITQYMNYI